MWLVSNLFTTPKYYSPHFENSLRDNAPKRGIPTATEQQEKCTLARRSRPTTYYYNAEGGKNLYGDKTLQETGKEVPFLLEKRNELDEKEF